VPLAHATLHPPNESTKIEVVFEFCNTHCAGTFAAPTARARVATNLSTMRIIKAYPRQLQPTQPSRRLADLLIADTADLLPRCFSYCTAKSINPRSGSVDSSFTFTLSPRRVLLRPAPHAVHVRIERAHKRPVLAHSGNDSRECLPDPRLQTTAAMRFSIVRSTLRALSSISVQRVAIVFNSSSEYGPLALQTMP